FVRLSAHHRDLLSFPTRRSSDLGEGGGWIVAEGTPEDVVEYARSISPKVSASRPRASRAKAAAAAGTAGASLAKARSYTGELLADRKSTRLNSSHVKISYAVFCL